MKSRKLSTILQVLSGLAVLVTVVVVYRIKLAYRPISPPTYQGFIISKTASAVSVGRADGQIETYAEIQPSTQIVDARTKPRRLIGEGALLPGLRVNLWQTSVQETYPLRSRVSHIEVIMP